MQVHVIECGRLVGNRPVLRANEWTSLLRRREDYEFPVLAFVLEHEEGLIAIDSGIASRVRVPLAQRRFVPSPACGPESEIGPRMRAHGIDPQQVGRVIVTHLDWDHAGGLGHLPNARVLVHRPEWEFASTRLGRSRYQPSLWPGGLTPELYDLEDEPYGPFPRSRAITGDGAVRLVGLPGHSIGQVGVVVELAGTRLVFCADHVLRADWFAEDVAAGRLVGLGMFHRDLAIETSGRLHALTSEPRTILLPSHDSTVPARLAAATADPRAANMTSVTS